MQALVVRAFREPPVFAWETVPVPAAPREGGVLIRVRSAGLNYADWMMARGHYHRLPGLPYVAGMEVAGEVVQVAGSAPDELAPGRPVAAFTGTGGFAEYVWARPERCIPLTGLLPERVDWLTAGGLPVIMLTADAALHRFGELRPGTAVVITGAAGGLGQFLVRWAAAEGAWVIGVAGGPAKCELVEALGAMRCIDYKDDAASLSERILGATDGRPVDLVLDSVGGPNFAELIKVAAPFARVVALGVAGGNTMVPLSRIIRRSVTVCGFVFHELLDRPDLLARNWKELHKKIVSNPVMPQVAPIDRAELPERLAALGEGRTTGKLAVSIP